MKVKRKMKSLSRVRLTATPWTTAYQSPPSMGFSRQEYWSGVPLPSPLQNTKLLYIKRKGAKLNSKQNHDGNIHWGRQEERGRERGRKLNKGGRKRQGKIEKEKNEG